MTLTWRLTLLLLAVFVGLSGVLLYHSLKTADRYYQDITQELSAPIAMYVAENRPPFRDGVFDALAFRELARTAMVLNPSVEVYALDTSGRILALGESTHPLARDRVELAPLRKFIGRAGHRGDLLVGDDPRDAQARRIFSAATVGPPQRPWGYVYVILDSSARQETIARALPVHAFTFAGGGIVVILLSGFIVAALLFGRLALPLRSLAHEVSSFEAQVSARRSDPPRIERDEIARLRLGFERLRLRVSKQMQALQLADASRREWIAHLSHDLRKPLSTLRSHLEAVLRRDGIASTSERREGIARALIHCEQISRLLAELFESARLEAPTLELHRECFALAELAQDAALGFRDAAEAKGVRIECEIEASDSTIEADIGLFQRLIDNLLTNAVKASQGDSAVILSVRRMSRMVVLTVSDTGAGPTSNMLRVFNDAAEPTIGASGLGLRIIAQILRLHGLQSRIEAAINGGTLIRIDVPAAADEAMMQSAPSRPRFVSRTAATHSRSDRSP